MMANWLVLLMRRMAAEEPAPCVECQNFRRCATHALACTAFGEYVRGQEHGQCAARRKPTRTPKPTSRDDPTADLYRLIFLGGEG